MSANLSHAAQGFVNCVVVGKDIVPRLSVVNIGRLIDELVSASLKLPVNTTFCVATWHKTCKLSVHEHRTNDS